MRRFGFASPRVATSAFLALGLLSAAGCGDDNSSGATSSGGVGAQTPRLWNDVSSRSGSGTGDTPLLWRDPNTARTLFGVLDPTDIRTYTLPDIYILGNKHPLMTDIDSRNFPAIINKENNLTEYLREWRILEYEFELRPMRRTDLGFPREAFLTEYLDLRRNARAHAKHYAVWHTDAALPLWNAEGDNVINNGTAIVRIEPNNAPVGATRADGRLPKSMIDVDRAGQLVLSGPEFDSPANAFANLIQNFPDFLKHQHFTHLGVGYWSGTGARLHYWNAVYARNPRTTFTGPRLPFLFGF